MKTNSEIIELLLPTLLELSEPGEDYKSLHLTLSISNDGPRLEIGVWRGSAETIARGASFEEVARAIEQLNPENLRATKIAKLEQELAALKSS